MPLLKIDMHVHTVRSPDAHTKREDLPAIIKSKRLDGVAVTEHNVFDPPAFDDALILPGVEISSRDGHIIALGIREMIQPGLPADDTIQRIHEQDGVAIVPHPYDPVSKCVKLARLKTRPDAVETVNADALSFYLSNWLAEETPSDSRFPRLEAAIPIFPKPSETPTP